MGKGGAYKNQHQGMVAIETAVPHLATLREACHPALGWQSRGGSGDSSTDCSGSHCSTTSQTPPGTPPSLSAQRSLTAVATSVKHRSEHCRQQAATDEKHAQTRRPRQAEVKKSDLCMQAMLECEVHWQAPIEDIFSDQQYSESVMQMPQGVIGSSCVAPSVSRLDRPSGPLVGCACGLAPLVLGPKLMSMSVLQGIPDLRDRAVLAPVALTPRTTAPPAMPTGSPPTPPPGLELSPALKTEPADLPMLSWDLPPGLGSAVHSPPYAMVQVDAHSDPTIQLHASRMPSSPRTALLAACGAWGALSNVQAQKKIPSSIPSVLPRSPPPTIPPPLLSELPPPPPPPVHTALVQP